MWKVVPQSRTGGRETRVTEFMCMRHEQLPHVTGVGPQWATANVRQKATVVCEVRGSRSNKRLMGAISHKHRPAALFTKRPGGADVIAADMQTTEQLHRETDAIEETRTGGYLPWTPAPLETTSRTCAPS